MLFSHSMTELAEVSQSHMQNLSCVFCVTQNFNFDIFLSIGQENLVSGTAALLTLKQKSYQVLLLFNIQRPKS